MAEHWLGALPVVERSDRRRLLGVITEFDLLKARHRQLIEERHRERVFRFGRLTLGGPAIAVPPSALAGTGTHLDGAPAPDPARS